MTKKEQTNRERKSCIPMVDISIPSITIRPLIGSTYGQLRERNLHGLKQPTNLKMLMANVDFPLPIQRKSKLNVQIQIKKKNNEPVRPKRPTRSPAFKVNDTSCNTSGRSGAYLMIRFSTTRRESFWLFDGQYAGTR